MENYMHNCQTTWNKDDTITITVTKSYTVKQSDLVTTELPKTCYQCPSGYMKYDCGRRVPLDRECRPDTCRLRTLDQYLEDLCTKGADE